MEQYASTALITMLPHIAPCPIPAFLEVPLIYSDSINNNSFSGAESRELNLNRDFNKQIVDCALNYYFKSMTNKADTPASAKKRPLYLLILLIIWTIIRTIFVTYAVIFSIVGTLAIYLGYTHGKAYFENHLMKPINEVKQLITENPTETAFMKQYREQLREAGESDSLVWKFVPLDSIADILKIMVLAAEDDGFYTHPGFSLDAIVEAIERNRNSNSFRSGGSTITQQVAKNFFLTPEKSFERKFMEIGYALLLEKYLGKDRILELYLNYAQWGKNIFGCEAAANVYYRKSSANLTRTEAARMASTLAMPTRITPHHTRSNFMAKRIAVIANNMYIRGQIDDAGYLALTGYPHPNAETVRDADISDIGNTGNVSGVNDAGANRKRDEHKEKAVEVLKKEIEPPKEETTKQRRFKGGTNSSRSKQ